MICWVVNICVCRLHAFFFEHRPEGSDCCFIGFMIKIKAVHWKSLQALRMWKSLNNSLCWSNEKLSKAQNNAENRCRHSDKIRKVLKKKIAPSTKLMKTNWTVVVDVIQKRAKSQQSGKPLMINHCRHGDEKYLKYFLDQLRSQRGD